MKVSFVIGTILLASLASPSSAEAPSDAACFLLSNAFAKQAPEPAQKKRAESALFFYFGRLDALLNPAQLKAALAQDGKRITGPTAPAMMTACSQAMAAKEQALQRISQELRQGK